MNKKEEARALYAKARTDAKAKYDAFVERARLALSESEEVAAGIYDRIISQAWAEHEIYMNAAWETCRQAIAKIEEQEGTDYDRHKS